MEKKLQRGCVVYMKSDSGMKGYGNEQCVSWVSHEIGELSLFGHNEHYKTYHVREIKSYPSEPTPLPVQQGAEEIVEDTFKGLSDFIKDPDILQWYKSLIVTCMEEYAQQGK